MTAPSALWHTPEECPSVERRQLFPEGRHWNSLGPRNTRPKFRDSHPHTEFHPPGSGAGGVKWLGLGVDDD